MLEIESAIVRIQWWCGSYRSKWQIEKVKEDGEVKLHQEAITKRQILLGEKGANEGTRRDKSETQGSVFKAT